MGSYDTGEVSYTPRESSTPVRRSEPRMDPPAPTAPRSDYNPSLKTIVALGGGLTPDRIVHPVPDAVRDGDLSSVVKYLMGDDVATRPEDRTIVEAVQDRMRRPDYRVIINQGLNYHNEKMSTPLSLYLQVKTQAGEDGEIKYNFADVAVVSHDEGGRKRKPLERLL